MIDPNENLEKKFIRRGKWLYFFTFFFGPVSYAVKIILSGTLSVEEIWILYGVVSLVMLLATYNDLGCTQALNYFLPKAAAVWDWSRFRAYLAVAFGAQIVTSVLIGAILFFSRNALAIGYFHDARAADVIAVFCLFFLGVNIFQIATTVFEATQNTFLQKWAEFVRLASMLAFVVVLWFSGASTISAYAPAWIFGLGMGIAVSLVPLYRSYWRAYLAHVPTAITRRELGQFVRYALWVVLTANVTMILAQVDMQIVLLLLGTREAGYYSNYLSLINIPFIFSVPAIHFLFPVIAHMDDETARKKIRILKGAFTRAFVVFGLLSGGFLFAFSEPMAVLFFGEAYRASGVILAYSSLLIVFNLLLQLNFQILGATDRMKIRMIILIVGLVVNIGASLALIEGLGTSGVSLGVAIAWVVMYGLSEYVLKKEASELRILFIIKNIVALIVIVAAWRYITPMLPDDRILLLVILGGLGFSSILVYALANFSDTRNIIRTLRRARRSDSS